MNDELSAAELSKVIAGNEITLQWDKLLAVGGLMTKFITSVGMYNTRNDREERDARWAEREHAQRQFHLRLGLERAQDKSGFLRKHCGLR